MANDVKNNMNYKKQSIFFKTDISFLQEFQYW